jgi:hypothetical protein
LEHRHVRRALVIERRANRRATQLNGSIPRGTDCNLSDGYQRSGRGCDGLTAVHDVLVLDGNGKPALGQLALAIPPSTSGM